MYARSIYIYMCNISFRSFISLFYFLFLTPKKLFFFFISRLPGIQIQPHHGVSIFSTNRLEHRHRRATHALYISFILSKSLIGSLRFTSRYIRLDFFKNIYLCGVGAHRNIYNRSKVSSSLRLI